MSWDVSIIKFSKKYKSLGEVPEEEQPLSLGPKEDLQRAILEFFPNTDWKDPDWGIFVSKFGSIEFNIGKEDPTTSLMLHVRATDEIVLPIVELCRKNSWCAIDCSFGEFLESAENPTKGIESWRTYLDQVLNNA